MAVIRKDQKYNGMSGVNDNTAAQLGAYQSGYQKGADVTAAEKNLANYQGEWKPSEDTTASKNKLATYQEGYTPSDTVTAAMNRLQEIQNAKPAAYTSKYGAALDNILQQIQNPEEFKYEFNGDELFKSYADMYGRQANLGMMNAMGNAAALTGGYGNSYAQQVGQQTYDEYMNDLYGIGMDLYDRAYQRYGDKRADLYNQYGAISAQDQTNYGRYRDTVGDWKDELGYWTDYANNERNFDYGQYSDMLNYWTDAYNNERNFDYGKYMNERDYWTDRSNDLYNRDYGEYSDMLNYWTGMAGQENADYWTGKEFDENQRQFDISAAENQRQFDITTEENRRQFNESMAENKRQFDANLAENQRQFDVSTAEGRRQFDAQLQENIRQFDASLDWDKLSTEQKYAVQYCLDILANGQMPSDALLAAAGMSREDASKLIPPTIEAGGGGGNGGGNSNQIYRDVGGTYYTYDKNGNVQVVNPSSIPYGTPINDSEYEQNKGTVTVKGQSIGSALGDLGKSVISANETKKQNNAAEIDKKKKNTIQY